MKKLTYFIFIIFFFTIVNFTYAQYITIPIPPEHLDNDIVGVKQDWIDSGTDAFPHSIPADRIYDVTKTEFGIEPNIPLDNKVAELIESLNPTVASPLMLYFPSGKYYFNKPLSLPSYTILKGAGMDNELQWLTQFRFNLFWNQENPCIKMNKTYSGIEDVFIYDQTAASIFVEEPPSSFTDDDELIYTVYGATDMHTEVSDPIFGIVVCSGDGTITINEATFVCDNNTSPIVYYHVITEFSSEMETYEVDHYVWGSKKEKPSEPLPDPIITRVKLDNTKVKEGFYQNTIEIGGQYNWVKGVESNNTRRMHIRITGIHNTVSGCHFHHSVSYSDDGGRGYGVDIKGKESKNNRLEDNVFNHLRHSMLLEGDAERNVIGYNFSTDVNAYNSGFHYDASDMLLHGRPSDSYYHGPKTNLLEGNNVVRSFVDELMFWDSDKRPNGPFNTFFRNHTRTDDENGWFEIQETDLEYKGGQYRQNVLACNMPTDESTMDRLDETDGIGEAYGFHKWFNGDGTYYLDIPPNLGYRSFYNENPPDFFPNWIDYPYVPDNNKIIPAKYRWDSQQSGGWYDPVPIPVIQGWGDYDNLCGPPNYFFENEVWSNQDKEYVATNEITLKNVQIIANNEITLYAGEKVTLEPGTIIHHNNNHVLIKAGSDCSGKSFLSSKYDIYNQVENVPSFLFKKKGIQKLEEAVKKATASNVINEDILNEVTIFPNPNSGEFYIQKNGTITKKDIFIIGTMGNSLNFSVEGNKVIIEPSYKGIILIRLTSETTSETFKLIIK